MPASWSVVLTSDRARVERYYAGYSVNTWEVLRQAGVRGRPAVLGPDDLLGLDHDHRGGVEETDALADALGVGVDDRVLDLGAGLAGPARRIVSRRGCRVSGVELTTARATGARYLSELVGLGDRVQIAQADMARVPFASESFTVCMSIEALLHVADKGAALRECARVLRPGGRLGVVDWVAGPAMTDEASALLSDAVGHALVASVVDQLAMVEAAGFHVLEVVDLSAAWRSRFSENCVVIADLLARRALGGVRLVASKAC